MLEIFNLIASEPYGSNCYLLASDGEYAVIDPSADYNRALQMYPEILGKIKYVFITHTHFDHMLKIEQWAENSDTVIVGADDAQGLSDSIKNCYLGFLGVDCGYHGAYKTVCDGDCLKLGDELIQVIGCPGHTPGGVSYKIGDKIFCGDTVFAQGGYGRCDLPGGNIDTLEKTLIKLVTHMPENAVFYPGHGGTTTLQEMIYYFA